MIAPRRRLRSRLLISMVAIAFGVLVVSALGAAALARRSASDAAIRDLRSQAPAVTTELADLGRQYRRTVAAGNRGVVVCRLITTVLRVSGGTVVLVNSGGTIEGGVGGLLGTTCAEGNALRRLPRGVPAGELQVPLLLRGGTQTGVVGNTAFIAKPFTNEDGRISVLVLTQRFETRPLGQASGFLIATGAAALVVATVVAAVLARRLTRPIAAMQVTAESIASGDLSARVDLTSVPPDELGSLARSLDAMADQLEEARGHERAFLLNVSHDLRTPLTSIKGYAEALADGTIDGAAEQTRGAGVIASEARRLERLVADLLDLARLDAHQFSLTREPVDVRAVVGATVQGFAPMAQDWGIALGLTAGTTMSLETDPERLAQIVANLVENALKHARSAVVVDVARDNGLVTLRVDDDGPGVPEAERERVFDRLYTTRASSGRKVGTGIGLTIVRELAGAMGGRATCRPLEGGGSRFEVVLPA